MARRSGTWETVNFKHGVLWWLCIGWWWRPIKFFFNLLFADLLGYKRIRTTTYGKRRK